MTAEGPKFKEPHEVTNARSSKRGPTPDYDPDISHGEGGWYNGRREGIFVPPAGTNPDYDEEAEDIASWGGQIDQEGSVGVEELPLEFVALGLGAILIVGMLTVSMRKPQRSTNLALSCSR